MRNDRDNDKIYTFLIRFFNQEPPKDRLKRIADQKGISVNKLIVEIINKYLKKNEKRGLFMNKNKSGSYPSGLAKFPSRFDYLVVIMSFITITNILLTFALAFGFLSSFLTIALPLLLTITIFSLITLYLESPSKRLKNIDIVLYDPIEFDAPFLYKKYPSKKGNFYRKINQLRVKWSEENENTIEKMIAYYSRFHIFGEIIHDSDLSFKQKRNIRAVCDGYMSSQELLKTILPEGICEIKLKKDLIIFVDNQDLHILKEAKIKIKQKN